MLALIFISLVVIILASFFLGRLKKSPKIIFFVGPHGTGKTLSMLNLLDLPNKTVTTTVNHKIIYKNKEIYELVPSDDITDFFRKFHITADDNFVFFVKNEEEIDTFPDCSPFQITFVIWKKVDKKSRKDLVYLDESKEKLKDFLARY